MNEVKEEYFLSCSLKPHHKPLRDLAVYNDNIIAIVEDGSRVSVWEKISDQQWNKRSIYSEPLHTGTLVLCVEKIPQYINDYPNSTFISGGNDKLARLWTSEGSEIGVLRGHTDNVNSISFRKNGEIITGGWDGCARFWLKGQCIGQLGGHQYATEVLSLENGQIITASTNNTIHIYSNDKKLIRIINDAHKGPIRKLIQHPLGFVSCSNDGFIKIWTTQGEQIISIAAHLGSKRIDTFIYGITLLPNGNIVSCGEDCSVKVWQNDGTLVQDIKHPSPVRSVATLPNGDIVTACTDRVARIFTLDITRKADAIELEQYNTLVNMAMANILQDIDLNALPNETALNEPGLKDGAIKMINKSGKAVVYQWDQVNNKWTLVGEALGANQKGEIVDGKEWDIVTDVFVTDNVSHQLCFNRNEDPQVVANRFVQKYNLPDYTVPQIVEHVTPLVDWDAVSRQKLIDEKEAQQNSMLQIPCWRSGPLIVYKKFKINALNKRLIEFNQEMINNENNNEMSLNNNELNAWQLLQNNMNDSANYHINSLTQEECLLIEKLLLKWPDQYMLPVVDMYRILMLHTDAVKKLSHKIEIHQRLIQLLRSNVPNVKATILRGYCNWIMRRIRTISERREVNPQLPQGMIEFIMELVDAAADCTSAEKELVSSSYVALTHNIIHWFGSIHIIEQDLFLLISSGVLTILERAQRLKPQTVFNALLTFGSIASISPQCKQLLLETYPESIHKIIEQFSGSKVPVLNQISQEYKELFKT